MSGQVSAPAGTLPWPIVMGCADCEWPSARAYPYPMFEDRADFETDEFAGRPTGTLWCPRCSPAWGEVLLQQMVLRSMWFDGPTPLHPEPDVPLLGGWVPEIAELEAILADFLDGPGPVFALPGDADRPHAPRGDAFAWACADLVSWMRDARLVGTLYWRNGQWVPVPWWPTGAAA